MWVVDPTNPLLLLSSFSPQQGENLAAYSLNLTDMAMQGKLDPVIGRDEEIRRCMQVRSRRLRRFLS